jgi:hypothetical protein
MTNSLKTKENERDPVHVVKTYVVVVLLERSKMKNGGVAKDRGNFDHLAQHYMSKCISPIF